MELLVFAALLAVLGALAAAFGADSRRDEPGLGAWIHGLPDRSAVRRPERASFVAVSAEPDPAERPTPEIVELPAAAAEARPRGRAA